MRKTTKTEFELFKKECQRWIKFWGLTEWEINYRHKEIDREVYAVCYTDIIGMTATLKFNKNIREDLESQPKESAFHEICELLLAKLSTLANDRYSTEDELCVASHEIIRRLENCVYNK